jgi:sugar lactone lactonase YvrE
VTGTFSYNPPNGTVLPAGTNTLVATFTPTDTNNYTSGGLITNTVVVVKGTPSFRSLSASSIAYGQTLAEIILTGENARVSTLAGSGIQGFADGTGTAAQFYKTEGVALDSLGNVYLADSYNNRIRKVTPSGVVTTFAGSGISGYADGTGTAAQFSYPQGVAVDSLGNVYVVDSIRIRKVTPEGLVSTLAGSTSGYADGAGTVAKFNAPTGVAVDSLFNVYVVDSNRIRKVTPAGVVTTLAGTGIAGYADGAGTVAKFNAPIGVAVDSSGNVYVVDKWNHRIRKVTRVGEVTTLAGSGAAGYADGAGATAKFNYPQGVAVDSSGILYVGDASNNRIRKVTPEGLVSTLAGSTSGYADGAGATAKFNYPQGVAVDSSGNVYVADASNNRIRKVTTVLGVWAFAAPSTVLNGGTSSQTVVFTPTDANYNTVTTSVSITVTAVVPTLTWTPSPTAGLTYPAPLTPTQLNATSSVEGTFSYNPANGSVLPVGTNTLVATFTPSNTNNYSSGGTITNTVVVSKGTPPLTWTPSPTAGLTYPNPLTSTQLNASSSVNGTFSYNPPSGTVLNPGTNALVATFTPTDTSNYGSGGTITNTVVVSKAAPVITWTNPAAITYGTELSATQLNASSSVAGTFVYDPASGTILNGGTSTLTAVFSASDSANYVSPVTNTVTLVVNKASPVLTWTPSPTAGLTYPAPLSSTQLTATSSVSGTFSYNPTSGTVLNPGTNALVGTFTPTDTNNYSSGGVITNTVVVSKGSPVLTWTPSPTAGLTYPAALSTNQLNATSSVAGTFSYNPTSGTVLNTGTNELVATFTPTDTNKYISGGVITNTVVVSKGSPVLTWTPSPTVGLIYPAALSTNQLNATSSATGTFIYNPTNGTVLNTGTNELVATFMPADTNNYTSGAVITNTVVVSKGTPVLTWTPTPTLPLIYPAPLSSTQLNATSSATGTFIYNPTNGTVLNPGTNVLVATFTTTDTNNYTSGGVITNTVVVAKGIVPIDNTPMASVIVSGQTLGDSTLTGRDWVVSTLVAKSSRVLYMPEGVAMDSSDNLYVADMYNNRILKRTPGGDYSVTASGIMNVAGVAVDSSGNVYASDRNNVRICKVTPAGVVTTLAGGSSGYEDGTGSAAKFSNPFGVAVDSSGNVYVADMNNNRIRKVTPAGVVTTLAGTGVAGYADGAGTLAQFNAPVFLAVDSSGNVYVAELNGHRIRKVTPAGMVSTVAGSGSPGVADGVGTAAQFSNPQGIALDSTGNLYVADSYTHRIRKVTTEGVVITLAGGIRGFPEDGNIDGTGTAAKFNYPAGIVVDPSGNLYVTEANYQLRKITPTASSTKKAYSLRTLAASSDLGTWAFVTPATVPNIGTSSQMVVFTPMDSNYNAVISSVMVTVVQGQMTPDQWLAGSGMTLTSELLLKYAVGGAVSPSAALENAAVVVGSNKLSLTAVVRIDDPSLTVVGEAGLDLVGWSSSGVSMVPSTNQNSVPSGCQRQVFSVDITSSTFRQFLRLRISR